MVGGCVKKQVGWIECAVGDGEGVGVRIGGVIGTTAAHRVGEEGETVRPIHRPRAVAGKFGLNRG